jgi:ribonuclease G
MLRELFISRLGGQLWSALREDGSVVELHVQRGRDDAPVGRIIKARVTNVLRGIQSAFLDVGTERGAFLHAGDLVLPGEVLNAPVDTNGGGDAADLPPDSRATNGRAGTTRRPTLPIEDRLKVGRELLVQVSRERMGTKGARVTAFLGIPGGRLVLLPRASNRGVSRRIRDDAERERLSEILSRLPGDEVGYVARTAAAGATEQELRADAEALTQEWCEIQDRAATLPAPSVVYREADLLQRLMRETPRDGLQRIVVDDRKDHAQVLRYLREREPQLADRVSLYSVAAPLFESQGLHLEIEKALRPRVWLRSGGYLIIEETEALVCVDVNTGKFVGQRDLEQTALRTNLEAGKEIARQLRLRDLGGIIVIDFIDLETEENRTKVVEELRQQLRADPARTKIVGLSELGLLQLTRKRTRPAVGTLLTRACPLCAGHGRIKDPRTLAAEVLTALRSKVAAGETGRFAVRIHPETAPAVLSELIASEFSPQRTGPLRVEIETERTLRPDRFEVRRRLGGSA